MRVYEPPEVLELGNSLDLTLGQGGNCDDNCLCHFLPPENTLA